MRILVTGSSGQLGAVIAEKLRSNHSILGIDLVPGEYTTHVSSITDRERVFSLCKEVDAIIHTASLHAPHIKSHSKDAFIDFNMRGTLNLLETAVKQGISRFVYTSTTSLYGHAMVPHTKAVWVTEELIPEPRDIYDITKIAAENLCQLFSLNHNLSTISLRISRFFPESDYLMAIYRLYRGIDVRDAADAHILALHTQTEGYDVFNISAPTQFAEDEMEQLLQDAPSVILRHFPTIDKTFLARGWQLPQSIDRVYVTEKAANKLKFSPKFNFEEFLKFL
jgi:UDP-glucose 4-epimerase